MTNSAQSVNHDSGLVRIAAKSRSEPTLQFNNLMHHVTIGLIESKIMAMDKRTAPGIDGLNREAVIQNLYLTAVAALDAAHKGRYEAPPVKRVFIQKADGGQRPIGIPTVFDRALQGAVSTVLESVYEPAFCPTSFGFRPGRGCHNALATLAHGVRQEGVNHALEVDIRDFFGSLNHDVLRKFLRHRISDPRILKLIDAWLKAGVLTDGELEETEKGTAQGGGISPLLANVYLHYVLDLWFEYAIKPQLRGRTRLIRYADDFVILFELAEEREAFLPVLKARFQQFSLEIATEKTHKTDIVPSSVKTENGRVVKFLGFAIHKEKAIKGPGTKLVFRTEGKRLTKAKANIKAHLKKMRHMPLAKQGQMVNWLLRGHFNYFGMPGNSHRIQSLYWETQHMWRRTLSSRSQRGKKTWEDIKELFEELKIVKPRLHITYRTLESYAMP